MYGNNNPTSEELRESLGYLLQPICTNCKYGRFGGFQFGTCHYPKRTVQKMGISQRMSVHEHGSCPTHAFDKTYLESLVAHAQYARQPQSPEEPK